MFNLIPDDWVGYAGPWIREIAKGFNCFKFLHFRQMIVKDVDLKLLGRAQVTCSMTLMAYIHDPCDRDVMSLVCHKWYEIDALTWKYITIAFCYTTSPERLRQKFQHLESLKLKGKPRDAMFNLITDDWGGYASPWIREITEGFNCLKFLHFWRMIVKDVDLKLLA
ncbi:hypothetical protein NE237_002635 [Protea cynaroides]|uniref:Uncharacterized protein n=1 Tax=Protea cynaroides TaxID=273540 RepID=A0A9Q0KWI0_9MAGN|nr:hypothetical protein NE237_002635 [Protea cynaroides]